MGSKCLMMLTVLLALGLAESLVTRLHSARLQRAAHKGEDKWSNPENWEGLVDDYESLNGSRCHTNAQCNPGRWCSLWGWCQGDTSYYLVPGKRAFVVSACSSAAGRIRIDQYKISAQELAYRCDSYYAGCPARIRECPK